MNEEFKSLREFGRYRLDVEKKFLWFKDQPVRLPLKALELLCLLVESGGVVVTKNEIWRSVWKDSFVEETNLTHNIYLLRKTFKDLGEPDLIETVPRRGYRFVAELCRKDDETENVIDQQAFQQNLTQEIFDEKQPSNTQIFTLNENPKLLDKEFRKLQSNSTAETSIRQNNLEVTIRPKLPQSIDSIAVLPLINDTGDADLDYLSDGIAESLIDNLSLLPSLRVIARTTVFRYKSRGGGGDISPQQIGAEFDVEAIVTGRIFLYKDALTIKIEIVRTSDGAQMWGDRYCRKLDDILEIQTEITSEVSNKLRLILNRFETKHFPRREPDNPEAYHFYLKGRYFWNKRTAEWMKKGAECFQQALDCDPEYALAYSGLADSYISFATIGAISPAIAVPKAKAAVQQALEINDQLAEAHAALGYIKNSYDWDWEASEKHFKRASEINPNYSIAYHWYGFCLIMRQQFAESIELMKQAQMLDPLSPIINIACGLPFYYMGHYERAIEIYREVLETDASFFPGYAYLGMAYEQNGQYEEAVSATRQALLYAPDNTFALTSLAHIYAVSGNEEESQEIVERLKIESNKKYITPYGMAEIYAGLKEKEKVLTYLEKAFAERSWWLVSAGVNPRFADLREEPRFLEILQKMNLT
jgi:DNA-binding winged helix-turn-helix (wHTH) protein/TolB-like protein/tetratricopeptide (TPR) repeat protein